MERTGRERRRRRRGYGSEEAGEDENCKISRSLIKALV